MGSSPYDPFFNAAGAEWNVNPDMLRAIASQESGGRANAVSGKGAQGLMQIMPDTARGLGMTNPNDPQQSIFGGAKYMNEALNAEKTPEDALRYYHGGPGWRQAYGPESQGYVPGVAAHYQRIISRQQPAAAPAALGAQPVATPTKPAALDYADFMKRTGAVEGTPGASPSTGAAAKSDYSDFLQRTGAENAAPPPISAAQATPDPVAPQQAESAAFPAPILDTPQPAAASPSQDAAVRNVFSGARQGLADMGGTMAKGLDRAAMYVNDRVPALASLDQATGMNPAANIAAIDRDKAAYEQQYGTNTAANIGLLGGQILGTAPLLGGANMAAGAIGSRLLGQGFGNFLTGQAGSGLMRAPSLAAQGAIMGGTAAAATGEDVGTGAITGAVAGPVLAGASGLVRGGVNMLTGRGGSAISPEVASLADLAQTKYGIPIRADQLSQTGSIKMAGDVVNRLPLSGGSAFNAEQLGAFNKALVNTIGATGDALTPAVMMANKQRLGAIFNKVEANTAVPVTNNNPFLSALGKIENDAASVMPGAGSDAIRNQVSDILDKAVQHGGTIPGDAFAAFTKNGSRLDVLTNSQDSATKLYATKIKSALQDALEQSLLPGSPLLAEYQTTRAQYAKMKTIDRLVAKAPMGEVSPALVMGRAIANDPQMAYSGGGDLGDLARIGQQFLKMPPNSGTPERTSTINLLTRAGQIGAAGMFGGAAYAGAALPAAATLGGSLMAGRLAGNALRSPALVNRLIQGSINPLPSFGGALSPQLEPYLAGAGALALPASRRNVP